MEGVPKYEKSANIKIVRFYTPEHNNSFYRQFISYCFFFAKTLKYAYINRARYNCIFSTSSRLGTGVLGYVISLITKRPLSLDIRDVFSDNLRSLKFFNSFIGQILINVFRIIEKQIISHARWVNFVSPGFLNYRHIKRLNKNINLYTNGIDEIFIKNRNNTFNLREYKNKKTSIIITYAGNLGLGQGLEMIVLPLASYFKNKIFIQLIGDGSSVNLIKEGIRNKGIKNIILIPPVDRSRLIDYYNNSDMFLLQLNNTSAFKKVLPSKIFDYGSFDKPILAGVKGVANSFIKKNLPHACLFEPGDVNPPIKYIESIIKNGLPSINNDDFVKKYSRSNIMDRMLQSIILNNIIQD